MSNLRDKKVLITGGASGIGKIMARLALEKGASTLIIWDINQETLKKVVSELQAINMKVFGYQVDVSKLDEILVASAKVKKEHGDIDILINNAGIVIGNYFNKHSHQDIDRTMSINSSALMHITLEFLDSMIEKKSGHIINIASAAGMVANPKMSVYCASKWAVIGWSDSLRLEMEQQSTNIQITTVTPYYINTGMFDGIKSIIPIQNAEKSSRRIIRGIEKNKLFVRMPFIVYLLPFTKGILPIRLFDWIVGKLLGIYRTMNDFKGRQN